MTEGLTFGQLFEAYRSSYSNHLMTQQQNENLRLWHGRRGGDGITLSQSDAWMMQAGIIRKKVLSITETGMNFSKFKKHSLSEQQFEEFLGTLAADKHFDVEDMRSKLMAAGLPRNQNDEIS